VWNGYLQTRALTALYFYPSEWLHDPRFVLGSVMFVTGLALNFHSDHILRNLRKPGDPPVYKIPRGGLFEYVSTANYTGYSPFSLLLPHASPLP
jgi:3-oxo-5-alpha-steroid 4-dehydrogenase 1